MDAHPHILFFLGDLAIKVGLPAKFTFAFCIAGATAFPPQSPQLQAEAVWSEKKLLLK